MKQPSNRDLVVMGASAGGIDALTTVLSRLPATFPAAVLVVLHIAPDSPGMLPRVLGRSSALPVRMASDKEPLRPGTVAVAPPDQHLLVADGCTRLSRGPKENLSRPAIDPLFRSAAVHHGPRVIGVVLSGLLDDGAAGLSAIQRCGGITIVQDPADAQFPSMPQAAATAVQPDHLLPASRVGEVLSRLIIETAGPSRPIPGGLTIEVDIQQRQVDEQGPLETGEEDNDQLGKPSRQSCPECGGVLWGVDDPDVHRYRCRVGHAYSAETLLSAQTEDTERALWAAARQLNQHASILDELAKDHRLRSSSVFADDFQSRADQAREQARLLRALMQQQGPQRGGKSG